MEYQDKLKFLSLGQGQGNAAIQLIKDAIKTGSWICLQNCHLSASWLVNLERILDTLELKQSSGKVHSGFRLWLTTMPTNALPESVLQRSLKVCFEPPVGLKANLQRIYLDLGNKFDSVNHKSWKKLLFGLALFHGILNERKKYFPLTFSHIYDWSAADLSISIAMLKNYLEDQKNLLDFERKTTNRKIQFTALRYLVGDIIYGGRVVDQLDLLTIASLLRRYLNEEVLQEKFYFREIGTYTYFPDDANLTFYKSHIQSLQLTETPELFGLHANAEKKRLQLESKYLLSTVIGLQSIYSRDPEEKLEVLVASLVKQLLPLIPAKLPPLGTNQTSALQQILKQESNLYNSLITTITTSLLKLESALEGKVLMSEELESMCNEIAIKNVPKIWQAASYPTVKSLFDYVDDLCERVLFFRRWIQTKQPSVFLLPYFFHPKRFLTSILQLHARNQQNSVDNLSFKITICDFHVDDTTNIAPPTSGVYLYGAVLEGNCLVNKS